MNERNDGPGPLNSEGQAPTEPLPPEALSEGETRVEPLRSEPPHAGAGRDAPLRPAPVPGRPPPAQSLGEHFGLLALLILLPLWFNFFRWLGGMTNLLLKALAAPLFTLLVWKLPRQRFNLSNQLVALFAWLALFLPVLDDLVNMRTVSTANYQLQTAPLTFTTAPFIRVNYLSYYLSDSQLRRLRLQEQYLHGRPGLLTVRYYPNARYILSADLQPHPSPSPSPRPVQLEPQLPRPQALGGDASPF